MIVPLTRPASEFQLTRSPTFNRLAIGLRLVDRRPLVTACRPKLPGAFNEIDHVGCRMDRQGMMGEARPWRNAGRHLASKGDLAITGLGKQGDHQVLQRNHADPELHQLALVNGGMSVGSASPEIEPFCGP